MVRYGRCSRVGESGGRTQVVSGDGYGWRSGNLQYSRQQLQADRSHGMEVQENLRERVPYPRRIQPREVEKMAIATIDEAAYGKLLARVLPRVIETEAENERMIAELEKFDRRGSSLTPEEEKLAELMTVLIRQFEEAHYRIG